MFVRLKQLRRIAPDQYRLTLDVVDPEREAWEVGDCVVQMDLSDGNAHRSLARGPLAPALALYRLSREEPPATAESRLLWEMGRAVNRYVDRIFEAGIICPFRGEPKDEAAEHPGEPRP